MDKSKLEIILSRTFTLEHRGTTWVVSTCKGGISITDSKLKCITMRCDEYTGHLLTHSCTFTLQTKAFGASSLTVKLEGHPSISDESFIPFVIDQVHSKALERATDELNALQDAT